MQQRVGSQRKRYFKVSITISTVLGPGLTAPRVRKHLKKKEFTVFGYQKLVQKGMRPRKKKRRSKKHDVGVALFDPDDNDDMKNLIAMDLPGRFPTTSASGNKYIFVMINYDSDYIKFTPMTSKQRKKWFVVSNYVTTNSKRLVSLLDC